MIFKKKTIGFWAGDENNFQFLRPIIERLGRNYKVKVFEYDGNVEDLELSVNSVDIAWFEWGNGPVVPASYFDTPTPRICRIHRYELYSTTLEHINWSGLSKTIFSSPSMIEKFNIKYPEYYKISKPEFIPIGVDMDLFNFGATPAEKQLIYVGRIHPHKNPSLMLQIIAKLVEEDPEYKVDIIGGFHDELYQEFYFDQVAKLGIGKNVKFHGKMNQKELVKHLKKSDTFIITSIIEGLSQASLEAMACGVTPVINNYYKSEKGYPEGHIYNTVDEAVKLIRNNETDREDNRKFIEDTHDIVKTEERLINIFNNVVGK